MKLRIYILSLIFVLGLISCNSSNNRNKVMIDPDTKVLDIDESLEYIDMLLERDLLQISS